MKKLLRSKVRLICRVCKLAFLTYKSTLEQSKRLGHEKYCSKACSDSARILKIRNRKTVVCRYCTKQFEVRIGSTRMFCSKSCSNKSRTGKHPNSVEVMCHTCSVKFFVGHALISNRKSKRYFCKYKCFSEFWKKNIHPIMLRRRRARPSNLEFAMKKIVSRFGFVYTGTGEFLVGSKNPDFVHKKKKLIVEVFGDYWHHDKEVVPRKKYFRQRGYKCLIVWGSELKDEKAVTSKVFRFQKAA